MIRTFLAIGVFLISSIGLAQHQQIELSHYLFPEFTKGHILLKSGVGHDVMLNYNALTEELVFDNRGQIMAVGEEIVSQIDTVFLGGRKFVRVEDRIAELLSVSDDLILFGEYRCRVDEPGKPAGYGGTSRTSSSKTYGSYQADGIFYVLKLPDDFKVEPFMIYWFAQEGENTRILNMRQLERFFSGQRDTFRSYTRSNQVRFDDPESIRVLVNHMIDNQ